MTLKHVATRIPATAVWAVTHPVQTTGRAVGFAKGVVAGGVALVDLARHSATEPADSPVAEEPAPAPEDAPVETTETAATVGTAATVTPSAPPPPDPFQDREPPIPVVEEALAAEQEDPPLLGGPATEPHAVTREEAHGEAPFVREELEEIEEETAEGLGSDEDQPV